MTALNTTISLRFTPIVVKYCPKSVQFFVLAVGIEECLKWKK